MPFEDAIGALHLKTGPDPKIDCADRECADGRLAIGSTPRRRIATISASISAGTHRDKITGPADFVKPGVAFVAEITKLVPNLSARCAARDTEAPVEDFVPIAVNRRHLQIPGK